MQRNTKLACALACVLTMTGCSGTPETMLSPTSADSAEAALNPDGSNLKVTAPTNLGPHGVTVNTLRPTLTFTNAAGRFVTVALSHEIEVANASGAVLYSRVTGETAGTTSHTLELDLTHAQDFFWRARARLGNDIGPWSDWAQFRTAAPPGPAPGALPFPVPAVCGQVDPSNGFPCAAAVAALSAEWARCARGSGVGCHRFTRQVGYALASFDPGWALILAAPGGHACNCSGCGPSDGTMYREDTVVYRGSRVFDMIVGAGGPSPSLSWSSVPGPRTGDVPSVAPLCSP